MSDDPSPESRRRLRLLAFLAFAGHYPAVRIVGRRRLRPEWVKKNVLAIAATLVMTAAAAAIGARVGHPIALALATFSVGHFAWSIWLLWGIAKGLALTPLEARVVAPPGKSRADRP